GQAYEPGQAIVFDGMQVVLEGTPANTDAITVTPSGRQDLFATLDRLAVALETASEGEAGRAALTNFLTDALVNLDQGIDSVTALQAVFGSRMRESENAVDGSEVAGIQYRAHISELQDLDYAKAYSDLIRAQTNLQAAQQTFVQTSRL